MSEVRVHNFAVSLDGFGTGEGQSLEAPFGHAQGRLLEWCFGTRTFHAMHGESGGSAGVDEAFASNWGRGIGAEILGRHKFGPQRGPWTDGNWKGWWGDDPPFHTPVFVLTHHPRPSIQMQGGTAFHFIDASPAEALATARDGAKGLDVRIGGGPSTVREFLAADLIDYIHHPRPDRPRARRSALGRTRRPRRAVRNRVGDRPQRCHTPELHPEMTMSKLLYSATMSLGGFIAGVGGNTSWLTECLDAALSPEIDELVADIGALLGVLLVGKRTFTGDDPNKGRRRGSLRR